MRKCQLLQLQKSESFKIYALIDPESKRIRYIGKTQKSLDERLKRHIHYSYCLDFHVQRWIRSLQDRNPEISLIELVSADTWKEREIYWIKYYRDAGENLTNIDNGGRGFGTISEETRKKMSDSQVKAAEKRREKYGGIAASPETRKKHSDRMLGHSLNVGRKCENETRIKIGKANSGRSLPMLRGRTKITENGRKRLSEFRRLSSPLFSVTDEQWNSMSNKDLATIFGVSKQRVACYRCSHGKRKDPSKFY